MFRDLAKKIGWETMEEAKVVDEIVGACLKYRRHSMMYGFFHHNNMEKLSVDELVRIAPLIALVMCGYPDIPKFTPQSGHSIIIF
ncbi:MAG: hypothetical protein AAB819_02690 [Patescibacteria group bacterium]